MPINCGGGRSKVQPEDHPLLITPPDSATDTPYDFMDVFGIVDGKRLMADASGRPFTSQNRVFEFTVVEEFDNCIECTYRGGTHFVAKPRDLRRDTYDTGESIDGIDYTYQDVNERLAEDAVGTEADETQVITPDYYEGRIIKVMMGILVTDVDGIPLKDENDHDMYLEDVTTGRTWAVETG